MRERRRLQAAGALQAVVAVSIAARGPFDAAPGAVLLIAGLFAAAGLLHIELELRRCRCTITPVEGVLLVALAGLPLPELVLAAALGEAMSLSARRVPAHKVAYNAAGRGVATAVAGLAYAAVGAGTSDWGPALFAGALFALTSMCSTAFAVATVERQALPFVLVRMAPASAIAAATAGPAGLVLERLAETGWYRPLVLLPLLVAFGVNAGSATRARAERELLSELYAAMRAVAPLRAADAAADVVAGRAMQVLIATGAAVLWRVKDGRVECRTAGDTPAIDPGVLWWSTSLRGSGVEVHDADTKRLAQVWATSAGGGVDVVLVVWRRAELERGGVPAEPAVRALAAHAALALQNAWLLSQVEGALAQQVDLNRRKSEFVASVSHELRTPLAAMLGIAETLLAHGDAIGPERRIGFLECAAEEGRRLDRLITDLLTTAAAEHRRDQRAWEKVDMADLLDAVRRSMHLLAHHRLRVTGPTSPCFAWTDRELVLRILLNLVENALKYSLGAVHVTVAATDGTVGFTVDDEGPGIDPVDRDRIFEPFVQLDQSSTRRHGGTGLGLHLCRELATALGGSITVDTSPLGGARFRLSLPSAATEVVSPLALSVASSADH